MRPYFRLFAFLLSVVFVGLGPILPGVEAKASVREDGPTLLKRTVHVRLKRYGRYWKNPAAAEPQYDTWCWTPHVTFEAIGPVPGGAQFVTEVGLPDGKTWLTFNMQTPELEAGAVDTIKMPDLSTDELEKKAITQTGVFPFKILLKNPLAGSDQVVFSGKFKVETYVPDQNIPEYKGKKEFFINHDWTLPVGYIWPHVGVDENVPPLYVSMWFRGAARNNAMEAVLYYKGKQIAATTNSNADSELETTVGDPAHKWTLWTFAFATVRGFNHDQSANDYSSQHFLDKNPGDYEIKVVRDGKLSRSAKFTVGADGKINDGNVAKNNKMGGIRQVLPVAVIGDGDFDWDKTLWKTEAFYGNPLAGFAAPEAGAPATTSASSAASSTAAPAQGGPTLLKYTLHARARRMVRYWKFPDQDNYWSWIPEIAFQVVGPVPSGSQFQVDFTHPDGKPWMTAECETPTTPEGQVANITTPWESGHMDKRAIIDTGVYGFKIRLRNELAGANYEVFSGKFTVNKFHVGNDLPQFKNQFEYYVDQDWMLPVGYLWFDYWTEKEAPPMRATMWFKGENDDTKLAAYLFYNGKQVASTKTRGATASSDKALLTAGNDTDPRWERWTFYFSLIRAYNTSQNLSFPDGLILAQNPGTYEIKVLRDGELVRTAQFTVGQDGKVVDNGIAAQNKIGGLNMILPVKVSGTKDGKWNPTAWKEAFYGNPLAGFTAP